MSGPINNNKVIPLPLLGVKYNTGAKTAIHQLPLKGVEMIEIGEHTSPEFRFNAHTSTYAALGIEPLTLWLMGKLFYAFINLGH